MDRERAGMILFTAGIFSAAAELAELPHRLNAELVVQEIGQFHLGRVELRRRHLDRLGECPAPALAIVGGVFPMLDGRVIHRVSGVVDRGAASRPAVVVPADAIVGQRRDVGRHLKLPGFVETTVAHERLGQIDIEIGFRGAVGVGVQQRKCLLHELQRSHPVVFERIGPLSAAAAEATRKLAGDDLPVMLDFEIRIGRGTEKPPIRLVNFDHLFAKVVDFVGSPESKQAENRFVQVVADFFRIVALIQRQPTVAFVGVFEIAISHFLVNCVAVLLRRRWFGRSQASDQGQNGN